MVVNVFSSYRLDILEDLKLFTEVPFSIHLPSRFDSDRNVSHFFLLAKQGLCIQEISN